MIAWEKCSQQLRSMVEVKVSPDVRHFAKAPEEIQTYGELDHWIETNRHQMIWWEETWAKVTKSIDVQHLLYQQHIAEIEEDTVSDFGVALKHMTEAKGSAEFEMRVSANAADSAVLDRESKVSTATTTQYSLPTPNTDKQRES